MPAFPHRPPIVAISTADDLQGVAQLRAQPNIVIHLDLARTDALQVCGQPGRGKHIGGL